MFNKFFRVYRRVVRVATPILMVVTIAYGAYIWQTYGVREFALSCQINDQPPQQQTFDAESDCDQAMVAFMLKQKDRTGVSCSCNQMR